MGASEHRNVLVLGASGLIGRYIADDLRSRGFTVTGVARRYAPGQTSAASDHELPVVSLDQTQLVELLQRWQVDLVVNCLGVLQDGPGSDTRVVHHDFVARLLQAMRACGRPLSLVSISIPGDQADDRTAFSRTKREAEHLIASSGVGYAILRPGFVIAPSAYGGSAMLRALAALPFDLPAAEAATPFQAVAVEDIAATVAWVADHQDLVQAGVTWDLMQPQATTLGGVVAGFRRSLGTAELRRISLPTRLLDLGAKLGDLAGLLGWSPPMRSTALAELRRGVKGDPSGWMAATGIIPRTLSDSIGRGPGSVQDKWFARLYLMKALIIVSLSVFWIASGFIALFVSYEDAAAILSSHRFPAALVAPITIGTSLMDMLVGALIAFRRTSNTGLVAGIVVALGYMSGAALLAPDVWIEPLGALVKTVPAVVLMVVAVLISDSR